MARTTPEAKILAALNDRQREAVLHAQGPLLIFAGAGSGKTRVLAHRMAYLVRCQRVPPERILAVTFTNKAAGEMRERIERLIGRLGWDMWVGTFHRICARILRARLERIDRRPNFAIFDEDDQATLMKEVLKEIGINPETAPPGRVLSTISHAKDELLGPDDYERTARTPFERVVARAYREYQQRLAANNAFDFDDLIMFTVRLFTEHPQVLAHYQEAFLHLLVDEYQDINYAQFRLVSMLAAQHRNLAVVGDDDQSIYGWRGADMRIILEFERDYPDAAVVKLEQNYRSTPNVLDAAYHVVSRNQMRKPKRLWTDRSPGEPIVVYRAADEHQEAFFVGNTITELMETEHRRYADFALLYRTNAQSRVLEQVFVSLSLPYRVIGGLRFYERKEIKDVLAYLRVIVNPFDAVSLRRIINLPPRGIGDVTIAALEALAQERGLSMLEVALRADDLDLPPRSRAAVSEFAALMTGLMQQAESASLSDLLRAVIAQSGYTHWLREQGTLQARTRADNVEELLSATREYEQQNPGAAAAGFLEQVSLLTDQDELAEQADAVPMMTLHAAKGLEFPVVFMVGMEEGLFPLARAVSGDNPADLEEERRLCYVGMTRAMDRLYLTHAGHRTMYGYTRPAAPSRFLKHIPAELVQGDLIARPRDVTWQAANSEAAQEARRIVARHVGPDAPLRTGDRVRHHQFGVGMVVSVEGKDGHHEATVAFPQQGVRKLDLDHAPLEKVE